MCSVFAYDLTRKISKHNLHIRSTHTASRGPIWDRRVKQKSVLSKGRPVIRIQSGADARQITLFNAKETLEVPVCIERNRF